MKFKFKHRKPIYFGVSYIPPSFLKLSNLIQIHFLLIMHSNGFIFLSIGLVQLNQEREAGMGHVSTLPFRLWEHLMSRSNMFTLHTCMNQIFYNTTVWDESVYFYSLWYSSTLLKTTGGLSVRHSTSLLTQNMISLIISFRWLHLIMWAIQDVCWGHCENKLEPMGAGVNYLVGGR